MKDIYRLFSVLGKWKGYYFFSSLLLCVAMVFRMLEPKVLQVAIDGVIVFFKEGQLTSYDSDVVAQAIYNSLPTLSLENLNWILLSLGGIFILIAGMRALTAFVAQAIAAKYTEKSIKALRDQLFAHIQQLPMSFHHGNKTGEMIQRCTGDVDTVRRFILNQVVEMVRLSAIAIAAFAMMALVHLPYAFMAVSVTPLIFMTTYFFFKKERKVWEEHEEEADKLTSIVNENLNGIRVVKSFAQEQQEIAKFTQQNTQKRAVGLRHVNLHAFFWPFSDLLVHLQIIISVLAGGYLALQGTITVGELASFYTYAIMVTWPMQQLGRISSQMGMAVVAMQRIGNILDAAVEDDSGINEGEVRGDIEFCKVSFKYTDTDADWALKKVSFSIAAGEKLALIGPAGAGKSTVIALLLRFYEPTEGEIFLDGKPLSAYAKSFLRQHLGVVMQKAFLFSTTIAGNIAYAANRAVNESQIVEAARTASIDQVMHIFPQGYDTLVGEKGVTLSGGQKQRVTLARTILEKPAVLILDDATSAVDTETEFNIQEALQDKTSGKTTIVIAHRATSIQMVDKIVVLEKGELSQEGTASELLEQEGFYRKMMEVQLGIEHTIRQEIEEVRG